MTAEETAQAAKAEAFFAKVPDPPANTLVALEEAHAEAEDAGDKPAPKAPATKSTGATQPATTSPAADAPVADRIVAALKAGDLDTLADLTDQDPASFDEKSTKWASKNRKEQKLKDEVTKVKADAAAIVEHYEPIDSRLARFHETKDYSVVAELVQLLTGEDFDSVAMKTFRVIRSQDPRVPELTKRLAEREAEVADHRTAKQKAAEAQLVEALRDDLPEDHQVRKLPEWETKVAAVLRESVDEDTGEPALSFKQAAQRVLRTERAAYEKYAAAFGGAERPARERAETPERAQRPVGGSKRPLTKEEFFKSFDRS